MELPNRKPTRLNNYDYNSNGYYFVTICTNNKRKILCDIVGDGALDVPQIVLSKIGKIVEKYIISSNNISEITVDKYVIMPNHIHLILIVENNGTSKEDSLTVRGRCHEVTEGDGFVKPSPTNNIISHTVSTLKRFINHEVGNNIFQRSFHDHIIRDEADYLKIWNYIDTNPQKWNEDCFYIAD